MRLVIQNDYEACARWTANHIIHRITEFNPSESHPFVLGLPTGSTPLGVYAELIRRHKAGEISFRHVLTFNMDEYVALSPDHPQSYHYFMHHNFFDHIDIPKNQIHILDGMAKDLNAECESYERAIADAGGIELFLGGVGNDGHIAFNEPGSSLSSRTRTKTLTKDTIIANSRFFEGDTDKVPKQALTVGVGTIADAREVVILASGHAKARALRHAVEEGLSQMWTISALQLHPRSVIVCDEDATVDLRVGTVKYFKEIEAQIS